MNPQLLALLLAIFWGVGGFFETSGKEKEWRMKDVIPGEIGCWFQPNNC
jgi:hypothetical protein